jgi:hypothetical protein
MLSRAALFHKSADRNHAFERYLTSSEPALMKFNDIVIDSTRGYVITLPLSYFISKGCRAKGKADAMPYESFRIINIQHRGGNAHSLVLIKSRAIRSNPHHLAIFESNGRNRFCGIRILDDHSKPQTKSKTKPQTKSKSKTQPTLKNVTKAYTSISPEYNINYGTNTYNPGYCGIFGIICVVAFRHYRSKTGTLWLAKWTKLLLHMSQCIDRNTGCMGVELAARVQESIATNTCSCAEREIAALIRTCAAVSQTSYCSCSLVL